jgi:guanosine-3',5'-bis(diphosphate) 3'-pyrophosphohydrolase
VEILTQKGHAPSRDWLKFVQTSRARCKIRHWINLKERQEATDLGRRFVEKEARQCGISLKKISGEALQKIASEYGCGRVEDLYAELGYGKWSARQVLAKASGELLPDQPEAPPRTIVSSVKRMLGMSHSAVQVRGHDDLMAYRAQCCNPIPGDGIVGYVTRGRGVAVHGKACPNVQKLLYESERRIPVEWASPRDSTFEVRLRIQCENRPGILAAITAAISEIGVNIRESDSGVDSTGARVGVSLDVQDKKQLENVIRQVKKIPGIFSIERVFKV